jgi:hypothetical protein
MLAATFANMEHPVGEWKPISVFSLIFNYLHVLKIMHSPNSVFIGKSLCGFWLLVPGVLQVKTELSKIKPISFSLKMKNF